MRIKAPVCLAAPAFALLALLTGCGGGGGGTSSHGGSQPLPIVPTPSSGSMTFLIGVPSSAGPLSLSLSITSTASSTVVFSQTIGLTAASPGCSAQPAGVLCAITTTIPSGSYFATVDTFAGANGSGRLLSQGQRVPFAATKPTNSVSFSLGGVPTSAAVVPEAGAAIGSQTGGYTLFGIYPAPRTFSIVAFDKGAAIIGPAAPAFSVASSAPGFALTQPALQSPNEFSITPVGSKDIAGQLTVTSAFSDPTICRRSGALCSLTFNANYAPFAADDWITFAHDFQRTGQQLLQTGISSSTVSGLTQRWRAKVPTVAYVSPLVYRGNVIVASTQATASTLYDLSAATGAILWSTALDQPIVATPTLDIDDGLIIVGLQSNLAGGGSNVKLAALRLSNGSVAWKGYAPGVKVRTAPVYANHTVYAGWSGGDPPQCYNGGVSAYDARTGRQEWTWLTNPVANPGGGGGIWGAISYDGKHIYFGTGNTCSTSVNMQGAVAVNLDGSTAWAYTADSNLTADDDTGSGVMLINGKAEFMNKNGRLYNINMSDGSLSWSTPLGAPDGLGGYATPTSDGSVTIVGAGYVADSSPSSVRNVDTEQFCFVKGPRLKVKPGDVVPGYGSRLAAVGPTGTLLWELPMQSSIDNYAAINNEIAYAGLDAKMEAIDVHTGNVLWSLPSASAADYIAGPVVVPSGLYVADGAGNVYAMSLPAATGASPAVRARAFRDR